MNRKQHFWLGAGTSGIHRVISYLDDCHQKGVQPDLAVGLSKTIRAMFTGGYSSRLPDLIDPPSSPRHRHIGHAVVPMGVGVKLAWYHSKNSTLPIWLCELLQDTALGVTSHLVADGFTPAGLNLLNRGF